MIGCAPLIRNSSNMQSLHIVVQKTPTIVARRIADELILVPIERKLEDVECLYACNEVGTRIWDLIDGKRSLMAVRDAIVEECEGSEKGGQEELPNMSEAVEESGG